jgi:hypothetical protein
MATNPPATGRKGRSIPEAGIGDSVIGAVAQLRAKKARFGYR